jgi:hypothetical protein
MGGTRLQTITEAIVYDNRFTGLLDRRYAAAAGCSGLPASNCSVCNERDLGALTELL